MAKVPNLMGPGDLRYFFERNATFPWWKLDEIGKVGQPANQRSQTVGFCLGRSCRRRRAFVQTCGFFGCGASNSVFQRMCLDIFNMRINLKFDTDSIKRKICSVDEKKETNKRFV